MLSPRQLPSLKKLERLTADQADECNRYFPVFNEVVFEHILSKDHMHREKGIQMINGVLNDFNSGSKK